QELIHLTGNAVFLDEETDQDLRGDDLKVWLLPQTNPQAPPTAKSPAADPTKSAQPGRRPHHVIAVGHVRAKSRDFNITDAQRLVVWFTDAPPGTVAAAPKKAAEQPAQAPQPAGVAVSTPPKLSKPEEPPPPKQPINLRAVEV